MRFPVSFRTSLTAATAVAALFTTTLSAQEWYAESTDSTPPARRFHALAHLGGATLMFGGIDERTDTVYADLWSYDGLDWQLLNVPGAAPAARHSFACCADPVRGVLLVFGGVDDQSQPLGDTWQFDGASWTQLATANAPSARAGAAMAFDAARGVAVLFGGAGANVALDDTWEFDGQDWTPRAPATMPGARHGHAMAFDASRARTVLFGGYDEAASAFVRDTWEWNGTDWTFVPTLTTPSTAVFPAMTFFAPHDVVVMTGELGIASQPLRTWAFDGVDWHAGPPAAPGMTGRQAHAMAFDPTREMIVVFGGARISFGGALPLAETYELSTPASFQMFGAGCTLGTSVPKLDAAAGQRPQFGSSFRLELQAAGSLAVVVLGFDDTTFRGAPLPLDLATIGLPGCQLFTSIEISALAPIVGDAALVDFQMPQQVALLGESFFAQALVVDGGMTAAVSNAGHATLGN